MPSTETSQGEDPLSPAVPPGAVTPSRRPGPPNRTLQWVLWSVLILVIGGLTANFVRQQWRGVKPQDDTPLDRFNTVPTFSFTERSGQPFGTEHLAGKIWIANFFFSTCPGPCLRMNAKMMELQEALKGDHANVPLVSFSVYPEQDTPEVLRHYAERFKALPDRWFFLTGERGKIYDVAKKGFMLITMEAPGKGGKPPEDGQFIHSTKLALVDRQGVVRHYYDSESAEVVQHVLSDIGTLLREQPAKSGGTKPSVPGT